MTTVKIAPQSEQIDRVLRTLATQKTITTRVQVLKDNTSDLLKKVMLYAYSPYIRFGVKLSKTEEYNLLSLASETAGLDIDDHDVWQMLDLLKSTTGSSAAKQAQLATLFRRLNRQTATIVIGILNKSVVTNVSDSTVNKAWPNTIPTFSVQLANKYADKKVKSLPQYAEIKYDGVRAVGIIHPAGDVEVKTRTGRAIPAAAYFHDQLRRVGKAYNAVVDEPAGNMYRGCVTDGELCGDTFNDAVSIFRSDTPATSGTYAVFDILPMEALTNPEFVSDDQSVRRETLAKVFEAVEAGGAAALDRVLRSKSYIVSSKEELWAMYHRARSDGQEGIIVKDPKGKWERKRSNAWLKIKAEDTADLRVIGAFEGEGEKEGTLGGLIVDFKGVDVRVGSGYTDKQSDELWAMFLRDLTRNENGQTDFELIGCLAEVQYQEVTPAGSLRHPVFVRLRRDKDEVSF